jgi:hypothetical protein
VVSGDAAFRHPLGLYPPAGGFGARLGAACRSGDVVGLADAVNALLS